MSIKILSDRLISQIAAGEVVERPASAVKELLENSVDAGANRITVEIEAGGLRKIRVVDNGCGMSAEDARLAFERHATSKIAELDDLFDIKSLGFRGEALASIASIARVILKTRRKDDRVGRMVEMNGGKEISFEEEACEAGTDITVLGLFHHTPARKKYMKSERTEYGRIFEMISQIALAHPELGFRLLKDGVEVFDLPAGQSLKERIRLLFGNGTAEALVPVEFHQSNLLIRGFAGKPELARSGKKYQFLIVNGRAIENRSVGHAVKEAFHSLLMHEKHPWYLLDLQIDPAQVDVNVHPRKSEVKFVNQQEVYRAVLGSVHHALEGMMLGPVLEGGKLEDGWGFENDLKLGQKNLQLQPVKCGRAHNLNLQISPRGERERGAREHGEREHGRIFDVQGTMLRPVAQIANSYIVAEGEDGLVLIDQHAAHERVRYARLMEALEKERVAKQQLLVPVELDLGVDGARLLEENLADFHALGFEVEPFGAKAGRGGTFLLRSVPAGVEKREPEEIMKEVLADLQKDWETEKKAVKNVRERILTYTACRGAIKFGDPLTMPEMEGLIADMEKTAHCTHCPHGRPAVVKLTFDKLEEMFKRKNF